MKVMFINHYHLDCNSGIHIFNLANHLTRLGVECSVCVPDHKETVKVLGMSFFNVVNFEEERRNNENKSVDIIHAWTPREVVRLMTEELAGIYQCPYVVHLEDNEEVILAASIGHTFSKLSRLPRKSLDILIPPQLSHPIRYKEFLGKARGISIIMDSLSEFCPPDTPSEVIWAGYEDEIDWALPPDTKLRQQLGIGLDERVVVYTGNVHSVNRQEVFSLYLAIGLLNRRGIRTRIVRTGNDFVPLFDESLEVLKDYCVNLGHVRRSELPAILSLADVLVQPGKIDQFNNYRFPSKLPEYLATGKPLLLPATNIGRYLKDGEECILLRQGHALEITQKLEMLFQNDDLRQKIGAAGRLFAEQNLKWAYSATKLHEFYKRLLVSARDELATRSVQPQPDRNQIEDEMIPSA
jgi:glycosyltransferase involved in cell wall biosynthesis